MPSAVFQVSLFSGSFPLSCFLASSVQVGSRGLAEEEARTKEQGRLKTKGEKMSVVYEEKNHCLNSVTHPLEVLCLSRLLVAEVDSHLMLAGGQGDGRGRRKCVAFSARRNVRRRTSLALVV